MAEILCPGATAHSVRSASAGRIRAADRAGSAASRLARKIAAGTTTSTASRASGGRGGGEDRGGPRDERGEQRGGWDVGEREVAGELPPEGPPRHDAERHPD